MTEEKETPPQPPAAEANGTAPPDNAGDGPSEQASPPDTEPAAPEQHNERTGREEQKKEELPRQVFWIPSGKDSLNRACLAVLKDYGLEPVELYRPRDLETPIEKRFHELAPIRLAVAALSGEYFQYPKNSKPAEAKLHIPPERNFELGFLIAKLGRQNVISIYHEQKSFLLPTNLCHAGYIVFDKHERWKDLVSERLKICGYQKPGQMS